MKTVGIYLIALFSFVCLGSCKKDKPTYPVAGVYTGTYTVDNMPSQGSLAYSMSVFPDGSITTKGKVSQGAEGFASGTWTISGNAFSATITAIGVSGDPIVQSIKATFSNQGTLSDGTWKDTHNPYTAPLSGKFSLMQRVN